MTTYPLHTEVIFQRDNLCSVADRLLTNSSIASLVNHVKLQLSLLLLTHMDAIEFL